MFSRSVFLACVAAPCLISAAANAADIVPKVRPAERYLQPAVDGFNFKLDGFGGTLANRSIYGAKGSFSVPLGHSYGLQIDGAIGSFDSDTFAGGQAHLFWRDPSRALAGLYVSHTYWDRFSGLNVTQVGAEGYLYNGPWSFGGVAGVEFGNSTSGIDGGSLERYNIATRFFDKIDLSYYINENFKVSVGHRFTGGRHAAAAGVEVGIAAGRGTMVALFGEGRLGEDDYRGLWGGIRVYWGQKDKGLLARHRQDDPPGISADNLAPFTNSVTKSASGSGSQALTPQQICEANPNMIWNPNPPPNGTCQGR
jgi:hypothetical protein